jgi:hypothetical protein
MTKRLQILLDEDELRAIQAAASDVRVTTAEWVRRRLREALDRRAALDITTKLAAIEAAYRHDAPAPDPDQMP